jgi:hypothetical protein
MSSASYSITSPGATSVATPFTGKMFGMHSVTSYGLPSFRPTKVPFAEKSLR